MSSCSKKPYVILWGSAHVAQHATLASGTTQPPAAAMASHDMICAYSSPIFAVSSAIRCAGASTHAPPGSLKVPNAAHRATIERRAMRRTMAPVLKLTEIVLLYGRNSYHLYHVPWYYVSGLARSRSLKFASTGATVQRTRK